MRSNCEEPTAELEPTTVRTEREFKLSIEPKLQCGATTTTEYQQQNTIARVNSTFEITDCPAASGAFTVALRIRDESGEIKPLDFSETWQRSDDQHVKFTADYPIGENVELISVRMRDVRCTCADPANEE